MFARPITENILESLVDTPVVYIRGARQTGKTTLVRDILKERLQANYVTLDNATALSAAQENPAGFLEGLGTPAIIDEAQKAPGLFPAIKERVDRERRPGSYVLTGSANVLTGLSVSDSLAGRMEIFTLWPLSLAERSGSRENLVDRLFASDFDVASLTRKALAEGTDPAAPLRTVAVGGYPEAVARTTERRRQAWFESYVSAILERDVRDLANVSDLAALPRLLRLLASRAGQLLNYADIARSLGLPQTTLKRYMALFGATFLTYDLPAWAANIGKRLAKAPKLMFTDTGLAAALLGLGESRLADDPALRGGLWENFVVSEIAKHAAWSRVRVTPWHFRAHDGYEVDLVLENAAGGIVGVEIKSSATPQTRDAKGLRLLAEACGERFLRGLVIHPGRDAIPLAANIHAIPAAILHCPAAN